MNDSQSASADDSQATRMAACHARRLGASNLVECKTQEPSCCWRVPFGHGHLCGHISNQMIAMGILPEARLQSDSESA